LGIRDRRWEKVKAISDDGNFHNATAPQMNAKRSFPAGRLKLQNKKILPRKGPRKNISMGKRKKESLRLTMKNRTWKKKHLRGGPTQCATIKKRNSWEEDLLWGGTQGSFILNLFVW